MSGIFLAGTDTEIGKTYVAALIIKKLVKEGRNPCYYKAALSGTAYDDIMIASEVKYVCETAGLREDPKAMVSFSYRAPVSTHLAARLEDNPFNINKVLADYKALADQHDFIVAEGSGGVVTPMSDAGEIILLVDVIKALELPVVIVAKAGMGTINHTVLSVGYVQSKGIAVKGIVLNHFDAHDAIHQDNLAMIERLTGVKVIACVADGDKEIALDVKGIL